MSLSEPSILISSAKNSRNLNYPLRNVPRVIKRYIYSCLSDYFYHLRYLAPSYISRKNANDSPGEKKRRRTLLPLPPFLFSPHVSTVRVGKTATETILLIRDRRANPVNRCRYKRGRGRGRRWGRENGGGGGGGGVAKNKVDHAACPIQRKPLPRTWKPGIDVVRDDRLSRSSAHGHKGL